METQTKSKVDAAYKAYYDVASDAEVAEETAWLEFCAQEMTETIFEPTKPLLSAAAPVPTCSC